MDGYRTLPPGDALCSQEVKPVKFCTLPFNNAGDHFVARLLLGRQQIDPLIRQVRFWWVPNEHVHGSGGNKYWCAWFKDRVLAIWQVQGHLSCPQRFAEDVGNGRDDSETTGLDFIYQKHDRKNIQSDCDIAIYSASVVDIATCDCNFDAQMTGHPA